ncbi:PilZ domain-containing protein [Loktanella salsilacus]|uniref:PilZ domain-containing protein n=1 Tax=Loktanella salsilacus TaxID=195913 RepID=UPI00373657CC
MNQQFRRHRYPTAFVLTVITPRGRQRATLIDVNQGGARLEGVENIMRGERITLEVLSEKVTGTVRWVTAHRIGIAFTMPARTALVDQLRQGVRSSAAARYNSMALREMR